MSTIVGTNIEVTNIKYDSDTTSMIISSTGQITAQGEGTATTNLQQGLSKAWFFVEGDISTPATRDSFNAGSVTDHATGDYAVALTNPFSTVDNIFVSDAGYTQLVGGPYVCSSYYWGYSDQRRMRIGLTNGTLTDCEQVNGSLFGDLA